MNAARPEHTFLGLVVLLGCLARPPGEAHGQPQDPSPSSLVKFLMRPTEPGVGITFSCGIDDEARAKHAAAKALVRQGQAALPAVEEAIDLFGKNGGARSNAPPYLLFYVYAKIQGQSAFPRLWHLSSDPTLWPFGLEPPSDAMALALGLTSYVPDTRSLARVLHCWGQQPRDALNQLILGWERGDEEWFESALGPDATAALKSLRKERDWATMRAELWPSKSSGHTAVGYRFALEGQYSMPEWNIIDAEYGDSDFTGLGAPLPESQEFPLTTQFTDKTGKRCGTFEVKFFSDPHPRARGYLAFLVDNSDLGGLLGLILMRRAVASGRAVRGRTTGCWSPMTQTGRDGHTAQRARALVFGLALVLVQTACQLMAGQAGSGNGPPESPGTDVTSAIGRSVGYLLKACSPLTPQFQSPAPEPRS
jgi:hypothetical protein